MASDKNNAETRRFGDVSVPVVFVDLRGDSSSDCKTPTGEPPIAAMRSYLDAETREEQLAQQIAHRNAARDVEVAKMSDALDTIGEYFRTLDRVAVKCGGRIFAPGPDGETVEVFTLVDLDNGGRS